MIKDPEQPKLFNKFFIGRDVALGLSWLHGATPKIIHRDLKPANILVLISCS
jgi:serine/threonine protein kinase